LPGIAIDVPSSESLELESVVALHVLVVRIARHRSLQIGGVGRGCERCKECGASFIPARLAVVPPSGIRAISFVSGP
jgi:hypothetical protein